MIIDSHKCIFVHVPRTGGTSIEKFFIDHVDSDLQSQIRFVDDYKNHEQHLSIKEMLKYDLITEETLDSHLVFAFVRNPWDLVLSEFKRHQADKWRSFEEYVTMMPSLLKDGWGIRYKDLRFVYIQPQHKYFNSDIHCRNLFVGRFENLVSDFDEVKKIAELPDEKLPHENPSKKVKTYKDFYTDKMRSIIEEYYKEDIERYGYEF